MMRWVRVAGAVAVLLVLLAAGAVAGLLLVANRGYVTIEVHAWLQPLAERVLGPREVEVQLPALLVGWLVAILAAALLAMGAALHLWRRRQHERLIARLERELVELRNLPFTAPAPLEDLPEHPDAGTARALGAAMSELTAGEAGEADRGRRDEL